jgi:hypothetical protein
MHINLEANLPTKGRALGELAPTGKKVPRLKTTDPLLALLATLSLCPPECRESRTRSPFATLTAHNPVLRMIAVMLCRA